MWLKFEKTITKIQFANARMFGFMSEFYEYI